MTACRVPEYDLAVIGGGQSANMLLLRLAEQSLHRNSGAAIGQVAVFERSDRFGSGFAWDPSTMLDEHLTSQPGGASRPACGREQSRRFARLVKMLGEIGINVDLYPETEVEALSRAGRVWCIASRHDTRMARAVVLATGHWIDEPRDLAAVPYHHPWPPRRLQAAVARLDAAEPAIGIVGCYHTALDAALTVALAVGEFVRDDHGVLCYRSDVRLRCTLVSRNGRLPLVWPKSVPPHPLERLTDAHIEQGLVWRNGGLVLPLAHLADLIRDELCDGASREKSDPVAWLMRRHATLYAGGPWAGLERAYAQRHAIAALAPPAWMHKMAAMLPVVSEWYWRLDAEDHRRFERRLKSLFFNVAMPAARATAERLLALRRAGCIDVVSVGDAIWRPDADRRPSVGWHDRHGRPRSLSFDLLVNGRTSPGAIGRHPSRLLQSLLADGTIVPARRPGEMATEPGGGDSASSAACPGDGIHVNARTCEVLSDRMPSAPSHLYAMGPNLVGLFLDAQSIGHLTRDAGRILRHLAETTKPRTAISCRT